VEAVFEWIIPIFVAGGLVLALVAIAAVLATDDDEEDKK
jgi:hypothetical protein